MKLQFYTFIVILLLLITSCDTEIPETDNTPPTFSLTISGDGFDHTFKEDDDYDHMTLYINRSVIYDITLMVNDQGGVKSTQLQYTKTYLDLIPNENSSWTESSFDDQNEMVEWIGDSSNPINGTIFSGVFKGNVGSAGFYIIAKDYGGENGDVNTTSKTLFVVISDDGDTELITN